MKILVCAPRHWTAGRRFRSLLLNAPNAGHEIVGLATDWVADQDLSIAAFNELGVQAFPKENWQTTVKQVDPDVIFAEYPHCRVERNILDWANEQGKIGLFNNHQPFVVNLHDYPDLKWTHIYYLVTSAQKVVEATTRPRDGVYGALKGRWPWPEDRVFLLGSSDLDFITEEVDTGEVRERLGVKPGQPLIGLFLNIAYACDIEEIVSLVDKCQSAGWQVVIHNHPMERRVQNSEGQERPSFSLELNWDGFYVYDHQRIAVRLLPKLQAMGARFIADYAPGSIQGVEFHRCQSFELIQAADCLIGDWDPFFESCALKKGYTLLESIAAHCMNTNYPAHKEVLDREFELQDNFSKVSQILERGNDWEQDPGFVEKWFFKLDGLWWKRALGLAERLVGGNHGGT